MIRDTINFASISISQPLPPSPPPSPPPPPLTNAISGNEEKMTHADIASHQQADKNIFVVVEEMPQFPGGNHEAMRTWIAQNLKYPEEAFKKNITGQVFVNFIVGSDGKIKDVKVIQSVNPLLDAEAIRVISSHARLETWNTGRQTC